ncbi:uncharacterized protein B0H18DRAFT_1113112 [Fomitopsis serialis]|uniref:uncharacterized protein n=1 Tax=Fomitopsis serialis TaxID=139415 RepID=UPI002008B9B8|nr:uncharacterized protein B0H18DRAFT_1113112 [Neoantrodia serialis]KAH9937254.1 hypothetical protein B0H18DRAFT_1113112 [Neoantrodia serialis]
MLVRPTPSVLKHPAASPPSSEPRRSDSPYRESYLPPSDSNESRSHPPREERFLIQYGSKLHSYNRDKAPYPASYNREDLELVLLDYELIRTAKHGSGTFTDFPGGYPKRCLDLGCGMGAWTIAAARDWPDCTFVGYDLMNVQIPTWVLEDDIAKRIEWKHGNFLRQRLPFEDEEFDFVHINGLAFAVPENKWMSLYEDIRRVLSTGGTIEQIEEDAIFPVLPRWFTEPLHAHIRGPGAHFPGPGGSPRFPPPLPTLERYERDEESQEEPHEHAFLESLFQDVFENRFINRVPSSCLPNYFSAIFGQVISPPVLQFPMPPLAPLAPLPAGLEGLQLHLSVTSSASEPTREREPPRGSYDSLPSTANSATDALQSLPTTSTPTLDSVVSTEPTTHSARSSMSDLPLIQPDQSADSTDSLHHNPTPHTSPPNTSPPSHSNANAVAAQGSHATAPLSPSPSMKSTRSTRGSSSSRPSLNSQRDSRTGGPHRDSYSISHTSGSSATDRPSVPAGDLRTDGASLGDLFRALGFVLSVKEAMWEELQARVEKPEEARRLRKECGWEEADFAQAALREKFEGWVERYRSDVRARVSLWYSMVLNGWQYPRRDPVTRAETLEEERLRQDILDARRHAKEEDLMGFSRSIRVMVGTKVRIDSVS